MSYYDLIHEALQHSGIHFLSGGITEPLCCNTDIYGATYSMYQCQITDAHFSPTCIMVFTFYNTEVEICLILQSSELNNLFIVAHAPQVDSKNNFFLPLLH